MLEKYFIYKYTFPNGKVYIGKTSTSMKRYGIPYAYRTQLVYRAMMKYPDFKKEILEYFETEEEAFNAEKEYIRKYNSTNPKFGYNVSEGGDGVSVLSMRKPVQQFSLKGIFIKEYPSIDQASLETGIMASSITCVCSSKYRNSKTAGGFQWKYKDDKKEIKDVRYKYIVKKIYKLDFFGNILEVYQNISEASLKNNLSKKSIWRVCSHVRQSAGGFAWCSEDDIENDLYIGLSVSERQKDKRIKQYDLEGNFIKEFLNIKEITEKYNVDSSSISHVCGGKRKIAAGFQWRYSRDSSIPENLLEQNYDVRKPNKNAKKKEGEKND